MTDVTTVQPPPWRSAGLIKNSHFLGGQYSYVRQVLFRGYLNLEMNGVLGHDLYW